MRRNAALLACALLLASPCAAWPKNPFRRKPKEAAKPEAVAPDGNASFSATNSTTDLPPSPPSLPPTSLPSEPPSATGALGDDPTSPSAAARNSATPPNKYTSRGWRERPLECGAALFFFLFALNYMRGKRANEGIASSWGVAFLELFESEFSQVGHPSEGALLAKDAPNEFSSFLTGRKHVQCLAVKLSLAPRHDLYRLAFSLVFPTPDRLLLTFGFGDADADAYVVAAFDKKAEANLKDELERARAVHAGGERGARPRAGARPRRAARDRRRAVGPGDGAGDRGGARPLRELIFTDEPPSSWELPTDGSCTRALRIVLRLPEKHRMRTDLLPVGRAAFSLVDRIGKLRLAPKEKERLKEGRAKLRAKAAAAAAAETREQREAQRRAEKALARGARTPLADREQQKRREEKEARQEVKRSAKKRTQKVR